MIVMSEDGVLSAIGRTPLVSLNKLLPEAELQLYGKLEFLNPGGSVKDRPALNMIRQALREKRIHQDSVLVESSSGNLAISLAQVCAYLGLSLICVIDANTTPLNRNILRAFRAKVIQIDEPDQATGEFLVARLNKVKTLLQEIPGSVWLNQYANEHNADAHYRYTMHEVVQQLGQVDYVFCSVSSCGTIRGCVNYVKEHGLSTKIVAVDAVSSHITGSGRGKRTIPGLGAGIRPPLYPHADIYKSVRVTDLDCIAGCHTLLEQEAILAGGSSGGVVSAVQQMQTELKAGANCVLIFPDRGERYLDTIYAQEWVKQQEGRRADH